MHAGLSQPRRGKACLGMQPLLGPDLCYREVATDRAREAVGDLRVPQHRLHRTGLGIAPQGMSTALTLEVTSVRRSLWDEAEQSALASAAPRM